MNKETIDTMVIGAGLSGMITLVDGLYQRLHWPVPGGLSGASHDI